MKPTQFRKMVNQMTIKYAVADNFSIDLEEENPDQKILEEERIWQAAQGLVVVVSLEMENGDVCL